MSKKIEFQVIDDKLLIEGILDEKLINGENNDSNRLTSEYNLVELAPKVEKISLSYKKIGRIENLVGFDKLIKLCLDNNYLSEIGNLGHLVNLKWLDLSFNRISKIQGLDSLVSLEDLSLYSNLISVVEGLDKCNNLQCLSLGNNKISSLDQATQLRQIRSMRMLTLSDNPICKEAEYRMYILAYVDSIKYLDYALIDPNERALAKEQYHDELIDLDEKEAVISEKAARDIAMEQHLKKLDEACILFAHTLFDDLFAEDADVEKLRHMNGVKDYIEQFRSSFTKLADEYIHNSLERHDRKRKEISEFEKAVKNVRSRDDLDSTQMIEGLNKSIKLAAEPITAANSTLSSSDCQRMVKALQEELDKVADELMNIEVRQVEKFEALIDEFENRLNDLKNEALESQQLFFRSVEDLEEKFSSNVRAVATDLIDRLAREELPEDYLDDEAMSLVVDKDTCMGVLSASHDMHIGRILKREDEARGAETKRFQEKMAKYMSEESARNRDRILQIHDFCK
eukprot:gene9955-13388_t